MGVAMEPTLAEFMRGWEAYQRKLAAVLGPLTTEQLRLRAAPELWSVGLLGCHVVAARAGWLHRWLGEGGAEMAELDGWDEDETYVERSAADLVRGLEKTWGLLASKVAGWTEADLAQEFRRPTPNAAGERPTRTRRWIVWHLLEHDLHHGGEISFSLGMHGIPGLDL